MTKTFSIDDIELHAGLEGVRRRPNMYVGDSASYGLWTIAREPADNIVDLALKGLANKGHIILSSDINATNYIIDNGPGIPVDKKTFKNESGKNEELSGLYVVTGRLHAGSNFKATDEASRGVHGLGLKLTTALSEKMQVWTFWKNSWYSIIYKKGVLVKDVHKCPPPKLPNGVKTPKQGTIIAYNADTTIFKKGSKLDRATINEWAQLTAWLVPKLDVTVTFDGKEKNFRVKDTKEYFNYRIDQINKQKEKGKEELLFKPFIFHGKFSDIMVQWCTESGDNVRCYTNGLYNSQGGEHNRCFYTALRDALLSHAGAKQSFGVTELREGILGLVNAKLASPEFSGQTKEKLSDGRIYKPMYAEISGELKKFFDDNKSVAKEIIKRACDYGALSEKFKASKKLVSEVNKAAKVTNSKLSRIIGKCSPDKAEIFLCEGDSAGGGAKQARDPRFQAVFALKGKSLNVMKATADKINNNKEIIDLLGALGVDLSKNEVKCNYGKIIIMSDGDVDGLHISVLLLGLFWKFTPNLIKDGRIYIAMAPLYRCITKKGTFFGNDRKKFREKYGSSADITYLKGLGEMQPEQLKQTTMNPETRTLMKITYPSSKTAIQQFEQMLGGDTEFNKRLLGISREEIN